MDQSGVRPLRVQLFVCAHLVSPSGPRYFLCAAARIPGSDRFLGCELAASSLRRARPRHLSVSLSPCLARRIDKCHASMKYGRACLRAAYGGQTSAGVLFVVRR
eukprot:4879893-Alexandrium_andersonii.AAC.1